MAVPTADILIAEVKANANLWDSSHPLAKDNKKKESVWYEIAANIYPEFAQLDNEVQAYKGIFSNQIIFKDLLCYNHRLLKIRTCITG